MMAQPPFTFKYRYPDGPVRQHTVTPGTIIFHHGRIPSEPEKDQWLMRAYDEEAHRVCNWATARIFDFAPAAP